MEASVLHRVDPLVGHTIASRYLVERKLGAGGMGSVYIARHTTTGGQVAVKVMRGDAAESAEAIKRFHLEAQNAAVLQSPHTVRVLDFGVDDEVLYLVMEFLDGESLQQRLKRDGRLPWSLVAQISRQVLESLWEAHEHSRRIIHRDIKPANLVITQQMSGDVFVKVIDFGIARSLEGTGAGTQGFIGTPYAMAPEQWRGGAIDARTDLYALGCVMFEMLSGRPPFLAGKDSTPSERMMNLAHQHINQLAPALEMRCPADTPKELIALVHRLLEKEPAKRPDSARGVVAELDKIMRQAAGAPTTLDERTVDSAWDETCAAPDTAQLLAKAMRQAEDSDTAAAPSDRIAPPAPLAASPASQPPATTSVPPTQTTHPRPISELRTPGHLPSPAHHSSSPVVGRPPEQAGEITPPETPAPAPPAVNTAVVAQSQPAPPPATALTATTDTPVAAPLRPLPDKKSGASTVAPLFAVVLLLVMGGAAAWWAVTSWIPDVISAAEERGRAESRSNAEASSGTTTSGGDGQRALPSTPGPWTASSKAAAPPTAKQEPPKASTGARRHDDANAPANLFVYRARLSAADHTNSRGVQLRSASNIIVQDRANVHRFHRADAEDDSDGHFHRRAARRWLRNAVRRSLSTGTARIIVAETPLVEVTVDGEQASVRIIRR